jgi:hypothetical protein
MALGSHSNSSRYIHQFSLYYILHSVLLFTDTFTEMYGCTVIIASLYVDVRCEIVIQWVAVCNLLDCETTG